MLLLQSCTFEKSFPHTLPAFADCQNVPSLLSPLSPDFIYSMQQLNQGKHPDFASHCSTTGFQMNVRCFYKTLTHSQMQKTSQIPPFRSTWHEAPWALHLERHRYDKNTVFASTHSPSWKGSSPSLSEREREHLLQSC